MFLFTRAAGLRVAKAKKPGKKKQAQATKNQLDAFIDASTPEIGYFLTRIWNDQQKAVTYAELANMIRTGVVSEAEFAAWQQDYAGFVNEKLKPVWHEAMLAANEQKQAEHPGFFFDPMDEGVRSWVQEHGAEWVTLVSDAQKEALGALIGENLRGELTVDGLARAIRPLIGLTKPQAERNLKYLHNVKDTLLRNNPTMKPATAEKRAREAAAVLAARQHRRRAYDIAVTELAFAYARGAYEGVKQAQAQGYMGVTMKVWDSAEDSAVCPVCHALHGQKAAMDQEFDIPGKALFVGQKLTPPAHTGCRCDLKYEEVTPPQIEAGEEAVEAESWAPGEAAEPAADLQEEPPAGVPGSGKLPKEFYYDGELNIGGTGKMYAYTEKDTGEKWLFKPAQSKSGKPEAFRAYAQEAGYKVQGIVDPDTAVEVVPGFSPLGENGELVRQPHAAEPLAPLAAPEGPEKGYAGQFGAFQKMWPDIDTAVDLKKWQNQEGGLPPNYARQLQREGVTDWLLGNYDAHGANFVVDGSGRLVGVDKEQAFKHLRHPESAKMSYTFHPNSSYGETEPVYNTLYRRFAKGELDLDLQDTLAHIKRVEQIPNGEYREIFRGYATELVGGPGKAAEEVLDQIVTRKEALREEYREFYSGLLTERYGGKRSFVWADEDPAHLKQPLAAVGFSPEVLGGMNTSELKQLAKTKQIPYFHNMNKKQLVSSISDPAQIPAMSAQVRDRLAANEEARRAAATAAKPKPPATAGGITAREVFSDLSVVPVKRSGIPVPSDKGNVEGLNLNVRQMNIGGELVYEVSGKLTPEAWAATLKKAQVKGKGDRLGFEVADPDKALFSAGEINNMNVGVKTVKVTSGEMTFELYGNQAMEYHGWRGFFRLRVPASHDGRSDAAKARKFMKTMGLEELMEAPGEEDMELLKKTRLLWQNAPARMSELSGLTPTERSAKLDSILKQEKIDPSRLTRMKWREVFGGYSTFVEEGVGQEYEKAGLNFVWCGVQDAGDVMRLLQGPGLMSTNERSRAGIRLTGASPEADMKKGGSDSVFTRVGMKGCQSHFSTSFMGEWYRVLIAPKVMERTDWYAYTSDSYGTTNPAYFNSRPKPLDFLRQMKKQYNPGNEIMFRRGIPKSQFIGIACQNDEQRKQLLARLKAAGVKEINGVPATKFVKVQKVIGGAADFTKRNASSGPHRQRR